MKKIITIFILCFSGFIAFSLTVTEVRQMRLNAMEVFDNYTAFSNLDVPDSYVRDNFLSLFHPEAVVYNDILPDNKQQILSPENYYEKYVKLIKSNPKFSDLELGMPYQENGKWYVKVSFKKSFSIRLKQQELTYPEYTFNCEMLVEMTENQQYVKKENYSKRDIENNYNLPYINVKIKNLSVKEPLQDYFIIQLNDSKLKNNAKGLYYNRKKVEFTDPQNRKLFDANQYNIFNFTLNPNLNADDYKRTIKQNVIDKHYYRYDVSQLKNLVGLQISYIPKNFGIEDTTFAKQLNINSWGMGISLLYSRLITQSKGGLNWYVNANPMYSIDIFKIDSKNVYFELDKISFSNEMCAKREVAISNLNEKDIFHSIGLSLGVGLSKSIKFITLTADLGFYLNYALLQKRTSKIDTLQVTISNIMDTTYLYKPPLIENETVYNGKFDFGAYAAVGVMFKLKDYWYLKTGVEYRLGFSNRASYNEKFGNTFTNEYYEPFFKSINNWHTNRFQINVGIIRKL